MHAIHRPPDARVPENDIQDATLLRRRLSVRGRVQGVGFRPFVYRLAQQWGLAGRVGNDSHGAFIEVEGDAAAVNAFVAALPAELPPLARISGLTVEELPPQGETGFHIESSVQNQRQDAEMAPDVAVCGDCLAELFDPADRRNGFPFINCMNCGPRYSIIRAVPYDRANTTMVRFTMCPRCQAEYDDPLNRRFHAQPNACAVCGPRLWMTDARGNELDSAPVETAAFWLRRGQIVAIKGIGGFHLACRADDGDAVRRLRQRKGREAKAFAVMVASVEVARELVELDAVSEQALTALARPIVLAPRRDGDQISEAVAPSSGYYGLMLPYTPLHHLLFAEGLGPLVMTSANPSEEPLCRDNREALDRLRGIADAFLFNDRDIERRVDDSVVLAVASESTCGCPQETDHGSHTGAQDGSGRPTLFRGWRWPEADEPSNRSASTDVMAHPACRIVPIRRARGYAPGALEVPFECPEPVLGVGGELKSSVCLLAGRQAVLSEHLGELSNPAAFRNFAETIEQFKRLLRIEPRVVACDLHPDYAATRHARHLGRATIEVQHHHAHVVSAMADNGLTGRVLGVSCDGTGYGTDGAIWGCEVLVCDEADFVRRAHLDDFVLLGGDAAARETWRPAAGLLHQAFGSNWISAAGALVERVSGPALRMAEGRLQSAARLSRTSSLGRLFDGVAFLLGICDENRYEAEAAMMLEDAARRHAAIEPLAFEIHEQPGEPLRLDVRPTVRAIVALVRAGVSRERLARAFHASVAAMLVSATARLAEVTGLDRVVLSGGCFANRLLLNAMLRRLRDCGLRAFVHQHVPTGDGGLALGQAVVAAERLRRSH